MAIQPIYEDMRFTTKKILPAKEVKCECQTDLSTDEINKVIDLFAYVGSPEFVSEENKIKFTARVIFNIIYEDKDGGLKKYECIKDVSDEIEDESLSSSCGTVIKSVIKKTGKDGNGNLSVYAFIDFQAEVSECEKVSLITGGDGIIVNKKELEYTADLGLKHSAYPIEEEFEIGYPIAEVLSHGAQAVITSVQCGVGCVIIDGEATVSALLLPNGEKSDIIKEEKVFPFRAEMEYEEAMPSMRAVAWTKVKSFKTDISVDEDSGKSTVSASVILSFDGEVFSDESVSIATDVFSTTEKTDVVFSEKRFDFPQDVRTVRTKISGRAGLNDLPAGAILTTVNKERVEITSACVSDGGLKVIGVLSLKGYFRGGEGGNFTVDLQTPFEEFLDCGLPSDAITDVCAVATNGNARVVSLTEAEISADVIFTVYSRCIKNVKFIKEVSAVGEKPVENSAISVYIPMEGEDLWSLSKRLNVCPDALCSTNKDLQFPLTGKERIVVYRQK